MYRSLVLALLIAVANGAWAQTPVVIGNGRLTVAVSGDGTIASITWPRPGMYEQVGQGGVRPEGDYKVFELERLSPRALRMTGAPVGGDAWHVRIAVDADRDVLRIEAEPGAAPNWLADLSPTPSAVPGVPGGQSLFPGLSDFACYQNGGLTMQFRPVELSSRETARVVELLAAEAYDARQWSRVGEGVWIATRHASRLMSRVTPGDPWTETTVVEGVGCDLAMVLTPTENAINLAFGTDADNAQEILSGAEGEPADTPEPDQEQELRLPADPAVQAFARQCKYTLLAAQDRETGAVPVRPWARDGLHGDWPRDGYRATLALGHAGLADRVARHVAFYGRAVAHESEVGRPYGSMPVALNADGTPALPPYLHDIEGPARYLFLYRWVTARNIAVDGEAATAAARALSFLTDWSHPETGMPLATYDPHHGRDRVAPVCLPVVGAGLQQGLAALGDDHAEAQRWRRRLTEINGLLDRYTLPGAELPAGGALVQWADTRVPDPAVREQIREALTQASRGEDETDWGVLYALVAFTPREERAALRTRIYEAAEQDRSGITLGDTRAASAAFLAVTLVSAE